jgi:Mg-chelatase subunit ChlI
LCLQDGLAERLPPGPIKTRIRDAPFVQIPLGVTEDRLVGTVDIEASMKVRGACGQGWRDILVSVMPAREAGCLTAA